MFDKLLFVCIGNICRSPMAEGLFRERLSNNNNNKGTLTVSSAGLHALVGRPATREAQEAMRSINIDISQHRAKQLSTEAVLAANLILVMEEIQKREIEFIFPHARGKIHLIGKWSDFEIFDPHEGSIKVFNNCLELLEQGWQDWQPRLT